jgi:hypothetical protein
MPRLAIERLEALLGGNNGESSTSEEKLQALHVMDGLGLQPFISYHMQQQLLGDVVHRRHTSAGTGTGTGTTASSAQ